jgi:hypothetical protein
LRLPPNLHQKIDENARIHGLSLNQNCRRLLENALSDTKGPLTARAEEWVELLKEELVRSSIPTVGLVLFGSAARSETYTDSDIDLLIIIPNEILLTRDLYRRWEDCMERLQSHQPQFADHWRKLSPQFVHLPSGVHEMGSLWFESAIDGILLFESNFEISHFLQRVRLEILEGRVKRAYSHGHPYWIRNEK